MSHDPPSWHSLGQGLRVVRASTIRCLLLPASHGYVMAAAFPACALCGQALNTDNPVLLGRWWGRWPAGIFLLEWCAPGSAEGCSQQGHPLCNDCARSVRCGDPGCHRHVCGIPPGSRVRAAAAVGGGDCRATASCCWPQLGHVGCLSLSIEGTRPSPDRFATTPPASTMQHQPAQQQLGTFRWPAGWRAAGRMSSCQLCACTWLGTF